MKLSATRYTSRPFPPYRFLPGRHPHPTADPNGHSYLPPGQSHPQVTFYPPDQWHRSEDYLYGCDLYNHGFWWEAHEAWEGLWQLTDKKKLQGRYLQSLIQVAARHIKRHTRRQRGMDSLGKSSRTHMDFVLRELNGEPFMGLEVEKWVKRVENYYAAAYPLQAHDAGSYPYILLQGPG